VDVLMIAKLDRLSRSLADFVALLDWCKAHGKSIVSISESLDFSTPAGRMFANLLSCFAQFERERMSERWADHARKARSEARWDGRSIPPGYRPVKVNSHFELEPDPAGAEKIRSMAQAAIGGKSAVKIAASTGHHPSTVLSILRNQSLRGFVLHAGQPVRGEDGLPVTRTPILDDDTWGRLQAALDRQARPRSGTRSDGSLLLGVLHCGKCGARLYFSTKAEGARYRHPARSECRGGSFVAARMEKAVDEELLGQVG
jgi:site-specific DNA recombinase